MNDWQTFLTQQGAVWSNGKLLSFAGEPEPTSRAMIPMVEHAFLLVQGPDAATFLQGQCTCDVKELEQHRVLLGAHCNRQGRMISSFIMATVAEQAIGLRVRADICVNTLAAMSRYIVFSKATMAQAEHVGIALLGADANNLPFADIPPPGQSAAIEGGTILQHASGMVELWLATDTARRLWPQLAEQFHPAAPQKLDQHFIEQGLAELQAATAEEYLPQHLNYQCIGAVSFKKGCYTGQEIVARMQYRGQLKKHCYHLTGDQAGVVPLGSTLVAATAPDKGVATVVAASPGHLLVVAAEETRSANAPLMEPNSGTKFTWADLPYAIP